MASLLCMLCHTFCQFLFAFGIIERYVLTKGVLLLWNAFSVERKALFLFVFFYYLFYFIFISAFLYIEPFKKVA